MASLQPPFPDLYGAEMVYDVVVIGAGINGSAAAYHCVKNHLKTLLVEQFSLPHSRGSSHGQSRNIQSGSYSEHPYSQMISDALPMWAALEEETGTEIIRKTGRLVISIKPDGKWCNDTLCFIQEKGMPYKLLDAEDMRREFPQMKIQPGAKALYDYNGGLLKAHKALRGFQNEFRRRGGVLHDEEKLLEVVPGTMVTVKTNKGEYKARSVVLTPGPWASKVLNPLGLYPPLKTLRINVPFWREKQEGGMAKFPNFEIELPSTEEIYGIQSSEYPGLTKFAYHGGSDTIDPDNRDNVPPGKKRELELLKEYVAKYIPGLEREPAIVETCMYTVTSDDRFIIDRHPIYPNIVIGCGFSGHGFKFAPATGKLLCCLAMGREPDMDMRALSFKRFKNSCLKSASKL